MFENPVSDPITIDYRAVQIRRRRDEILQRTVDRVNPIRYQLLTIEQQQELAVYRQALLDITEQSGFPENVVWPTNPPWLV